MGKSDVLQYLRGSCDRIRGISVWGEVKWTVANDLIAPPD
jgi:hypothetical protein